MPSRLPCFAEYATTPSKSPSMLVMADLSPYNCEEPRALVLQLSESKPKRDPATSMLQAVIDDEAALNPRAESFEPSKSAESHANTKSVRPASAPPTKPVPGSGLNINAREFQAPGALNVKAREFQPSSGVSPTQSEAEARTPIPEPAAMPVAPAAVPASSTASVQHKNVSSMKKRSPALQLPPPPPLTDEVLRKQLNRISRELENANIRLTKERAANEASRLKSQDEKLAVMKDAAQLKISVTLLKMQVIRRQLDECSILASATAHPCCKHSDLAATQ